MNGKNIARKYKVFSWNSKIGNNAIALNFSRSGGDSCSNSCMHKINGSCYAVASQGLYKELYAKLKRHEEKGFEWTLKTALSAMEENPGDFEEIRFFRFSTHGTVPDRPFTGGEKSALIRLGDWLKGNDIAIHFPVETRRKYDQVLACGIQPRLSFQGRIEHAKRATETVSVSVGSMEEKPIERLNQSMLLNISLNSIGKTAEICPAIASKFARASERVTCDICGLCASAETRVIIYPQH